MAAVLCDDVVNIGEFDRGGNVFTRVGAASVSSFCCHCSGHVPHTNLRFGSHSFRVSAPTIWNTSSQRSFLRISNNVLETSQNTSFPVGILCHPLATQCLRFNFLILALYKCTYLLTSVHSDVS